MQPFRWFHINHGDQFPAQVISVIAATLENYIYRLFLNYFCFPKENLWGLLVQKIFTG